MLTRVASLLSFYIKTDIKYKSTFTYVQEGFGQHKDTPPDIINEKRNSLEIDLDGKSWIEPI